MNDVAFCFVISLPSPNVQHGPYSLYYPIVNNFGRSTQNCWKYTKIVCPKLDPSEDVLDIMFGFVFFPSNNLEDYLHLAKRISDFLVQDPDNGDMLIMNSSYDILQNSVLASYSYEDFEPSSFPHTCNDNINQTITDAFNNYCDGKCALIFAEFYGNDLFTPVNKDYYIVSI